jgi:hypothetical protein
MGDQPSVVRQPAPSRESESRVQKGPQRPRRDEQAERAQRAARPAREERGRRDEPGGAGGFANNVPAFLRRPVRRPKPATVE